MVSDVEASELRYTFYHHQRCKSRRSWYCYAKLLKVLLFWLGEVLDTYKPLRSQDYDHAIIETFGQTYKQILMLHHSPIKCTIWEEPTGPRVPSGVSRGSEAQEYVQHPVMRDFWTIDTMAHLYTGVVKMNPQYDRPAIKNVKKVREHKAQRRKIRREWMRTSTVWEDYRRPAHDTTPRNAGCLSH